MMRPVEFLLVEDNEDHAELLRQMLESHRLVNVVRHVTSGEQAMATLRADLDANERVRPDVVLLDLELPGTNGIDVLDAIGSEPRLRQLPVVVLTSSGAERDRAAVRQRGAASFVTKPMRFEQLQEIVEELRLSWSICHPGHDGEAPLSFHKEKSDDQ
ncbi:MAG: response regulator [Planctomycetes bacterium]|nr:response regulator [Planctomycetota bacterium]